MFNFIKTVWNFISKSKTSSKAVTISIAAAAALFIAPYEGLRTKPYYDPVGILTVCYGETKGVKKNQSYTPQECMEMLQTRAAEFESKIRPMIKVQIPDKTRIALVSFAYNVGTGAFQKSTLLRKLNSGDIRGACNELTRWVYGGGKVLPGLVTRRAAEKALCLEDLK